MFEKPNAITLRDSYGKHAYFRILKTDTLVPAGRDRGFGQEGVTDNFDIAIGTESYSFRVFGLSG